MDVCKRLRTVKTYEKYMEISQDVASTKNLQNVQFNMSTIIALKNVRSLEIEVSFFSEQLEVNRFSRSLNYGTL